MRRRPRRKKKGGPFGPRIPEILDWYEDVPKNYFFAAFLAGFFAAFFAAFLAAFFVAMVSVTSSWQDRLTESEAACYVDLPSKDGSPRPSALSTAVSP